VDQGDEPSTRRRDRSLKRTLYILYVLVLATVLFVFLTDSWIDCARERGMLPCAGEALDFWF
jgi:hypothetical protein